MPDWLIGRPDCDLGTLISDLDVLIIKLRDEKIAREKEEQKLRDQQLEGEKKKKHLRDQEAKEKRKQAEQKFLNRILEKKK